MPPVSPSRLKELEALRPAYGLPVETDFAANILSGWIFLPDQQLPSVEGFLDGPAVGPIALEDRPDVADFYPRIPYSLRSGYMLQLQPGQLRTDGVSRAIVVGYVGERPAARLRPVVFPDSVI